MRDIAIERQGRETERERGMRRERRIGEEGRDEEGAQ